MLLILLLIHLPSFSTFESSFKMIRVFGRPVELSGTVEFNLSIDECTDNCYDDDNCSLSYYIHSKCYQYNYGTMNIQVLDKSTEDKIITNGCPRTNPLAGTGIVANDKWIDEAGGHENIISSDGNIWSVEYNKFVCTNGTRMFLRNSTFVCIGVRFFVDKTCAAHDYAVNFCVSEGFESITGPFQPSELEFLLEDRTRAAKEYGDVGNYQSYVWIDGKNGKYQDPALQASYNSDVMCAYADHSNCAYFGDKSCPSVDSYGCTNWKNYDFCFRGTACWMKPSKLN
ncbi:PAN-3 domain-containing protein [Caenorhabditis elegans]|uniref:PAN-3 domain-containing protein n=1 Tax=Caenorhabditis elegans TaxID=6239 RepID=O45342_CAEEL|nr:PAN-3 domain-containing protein [Caenorhabditis elegans]CAB07347.2 PAN-3 domain-containing protein [Caenorhabditis elegans]|eukprot:NP_507072.2 Uncharacterized protein CELE_F10A3.11 [Caenorhabditis elegans]